ncbi:MULTISPECIES: hypothetical protein [Halorussus]|uniref:hypothetical protein n=1 Tax=Halorussus TaxID=1070314 RepID=UPI0013B3703C|nr:MULTISPECIES: hypothetical protein [Halorussus]NHN60121.1 hypothetical protein [Halorussus sp. JP-T4]
MEIGRFVKRGLLNPLKIRKVLTHKSVRRNVGREVNKIYHSRANQRPWNPVGIDIFAEDWDNLIILDACRHDAMQNAIKRHNLDWNLDSRISRGSQTPEWLYANFSNRQLHDVVYVTASSMPHYLGVQNPTTPRQHEYGFNLDVHDLINVWASPPEEAIDTYVDRAEIDVVLPAKSMIEPAVNAVEEYPDKRIIVHIVQPHDPYWGETGQQLHKQSASPWHDKLDGTLDEPVEKLREAYRENVDLAVNAAKTISKQISGKTVISADHGEYLYERSSPIPVREVLHPNKTYTDVLVKVPWVELEDERREVLEEQPVKDYRREQKNGKTQEQLAALGYID